MMNLYEAEKIIAINMKTMKLFSEIDEHMMDLAMWKKSTIS